MPRVTHCNRPPLSGGLLCFRGLEGILPEGLPREISGYTILQEVSYDAWFEQC